MGQGTPAETEGRGSPPVTPADLPGLFLSLEELRSLFPRLKKSEAHLDLSERALLLRMERVLYENLSIQELETLGEGNGIS